MNRLKRSQISNIIPLLFIGLLSVMTACDGQKELETVTVAQFREFVEATGYQTDAEKFGWSIAQKTVYEYDIVNDATWKKPDSKTSPNPNDPVTQVSLNDAMAYCEWAGVRLPTYEEYWAAVANDKRSIVMNNTRMLPVENINIVGNTWDITTSTNARNEIRLAGGSYLCAPTTCNGTTEDRTLYVSADTGNTHISFSVFR